ncbi:MAG: site-2 protease family protein [Pseudomonadota bacterium]
MSNPFESTYWFNVAHLKPRLRSHVRVRRHVYRGETWYVLDDGAAGKVHRFARGAYGLIGRLDGTRSVNALWEDLVDRLGEDAPTQDDVIAALGQLHGSDLLSTDVAPETAELLKRRKKQRRQVWIQNLKSPMSARIPLVDPDRFLERTVDYLRPLLGWLGVAVWLVVVIPALLLAGQNYEELTTNLWDQVLAADNLFVMAVVYPVVKIAHELGHGYAAKANGREVRQMGVMLLVLFPVPYVDASAAGALRSKWQRALIGAAGMIVEVFIAALAMFAWVLLEPGLARAIAFNTIVVAGVSTLLVNGNPLLRFDAYYILADLIEIPNLATRSNKYWSHLIDRHVFRTHSNQPYAATAYEKGWFVFYAPAAFIARMIMLFSIALIVAQKFFFIGVAIALWTIWSGVGLPIWKAYQHVFTSPQLHRNRKAAIRWTLGATAALLIALFIIPAPHHANTQGVVWLPEEAQVRASGDSTIVAVAAREGDAVTPGDLLIQTQHPILEAEVERLRWRLAELQQQADAELRGDRVEREVSTLEMEETATRLAEAQRRLDELDLEAGAAGEFVLAAAPAEDLPGQFVRKGDLIGYVTPGSAKLARIAVGQDDFELIRGHLDTLQFRLANRPSQTFDGSIARAVPGGTYELPSKALAAANGGPFPLDSRDAEGRTTLQRVFLYDITLPPDLTDVPFGTRVHVRFALDWEPLGWQIARRVRQMLLERFYA